ncbi:hypothetical protein [Propionispira arboris]|uniref:hypothetical protein n=1 Tax=Propionispira arboris TaxID=84035 RepID=UPI000B83B24E|nr:hypothetical protein [Propionispira arboris]
MKSITQDNHQTKCLSVKSMQFFQQYRIAKILHTANANKIKGIPAMQIFLLALSIVFQNRSPYYYKSNIPHHAAWSIGIDLSCQLLIVP